MRPAFREDKAAQAAGVLLHLRGGRMSYLKLIKLLYLADREALIRWGRPITFDAYFSLDRGPVLSITKDLIVEGPAPGQDSPWARCISAPENYEVHLTQPCGEDRLSDDEVSLLHEIFARYGHLSRWTLVDLSHSLPEWTDPHGSAVPITYSEILRAGGKSPSEIAQIEQELEEVALADKLFA